MDYIQEHILLSEHDEVTVAPLHNNSTAIYIAVNVYDMHCLTHALHHCMVTQLHGCTMDNRAPLHVAHKFNKCKNHSTE